MWKGWGMGMLPLSGTTSHELSDIIQRKLYHIHVVLQLYTGHLGAQVPGEQGAALEPAGAPQDQHAAARGLGQRRLQVPLAHVLQPRPGVHPEVGPALRRHLQHHALLAEEPAP
eukprot:CAMPEP_0194563824 /NCGR_PEP_ID=MMETSP0292-20121207/3727_1 /TAXON_ID=39354 /ORGANISM="Heterosigma akashiwo, Strain CCMP2393" /LENGTH=113 /DNA_ID=CAMNT_0039412835 /DNA_START=472 /DNA_END=809 /DNA_ORIENTATION=+